MIDGVWWDTNSVSGLKVRCDPPLNLDLHPSRHFLASESILQLIVCSSHLKERRWLWAAGTSFSYPKGHPSCIWMGIHGKTIWEQLWREEGGCYCFYSDTMRRPAQKWGSVSGLVCVENKGNGVRPPPVIISKEVQGHRALKSCNRNVRVCTLELHSEGGGINNEAEVHRNKLSARLIYGP